MRKVQQLTNYLRLHSKKILLWLLLTVLALWGQVYGLHFIYGVVFLLGSIFLILCVRMFGLIWGFLSASIVSLIAIFWYDQPALISLYILEIIFLGLLFYRKERNLMLWDAFYWFFIGGPLILLIGFMIVGELTDGVLLLCLKMIVNGLFNVLIADILLTYVPKLFRPYKEHARSIYYRQVLFHFSIAAVVSPFLIYFIVNSWYANDTVIRNARDVTMAKVIAIDQELHKWSFDDLRQLQLYGMIQIGFLQEFIRDNSSNGLFQMTITNKNNQVLATNQDTLRLKDVFEKPVESELISENFYHWEYEKKSPFSFDLLSSGYFMYERHLEDLPIHIYAQVPKQYYQNELTRMYLNHFHILLLFSLFAVAFSILINRALTRSLTKLTKITTGLPDKLKYHQVIDWPKSKIAEVDSLIVNFQHMSNNLAQMIQELQEVNAELERKTLKLQRSEERLHQLAYYDSLTNLPNRLHFLEELNRTLYLASKDNERAALLFIDLNQFKQINDTLGHEAGDQLLETVSKRLSTVVSRQYKVFRLGGDEFVVILYPIDKHDIDRFSHQLLSVFNDPFTIMEQNFYITASVGISIFPDDATDPDHLLKNADMAMYVAKEDGGNSARYYTAQMNTQVAQRVMLENELRKAVFSEHFHLHYQPKVHSQTGQIIGTEALLRWHHPELGLISPAKFIPLAEETGLILEIDEWVLRTACRQNKEWQDQGYPKIPVAINVSAKQFYQERFFEKIQDILDETQLEPQYLKLEITEGILLENTEHVAKVIEQLRELGVLISIDDFGTGYSSLSQLQKLPFFEVKLDRSFIQNVDTDTKKSSIVKAIIELVHGLNLRVIAEGVETVHELKYLIQNRCDEMQGYLFSKPLPHLEFAQLLKSTNYSSLIKQTEQ